VGPDNLDDDDAEDDVNNEALGLAANACGAAGDNKTVGMAIGSMRGGEPPERVNASGGPMKRSVFVDGHVRRIFRINGIAEAGGSRIGLMQISEPPRGTICRVPGKD
jgi:hypothetical protein